MPFSKKRLLPRLIEQFPGVQANIDFICETLENTTLTSEALWRISRRVTLSERRIQTTLAGDGFFDQICDDRETIFPSSPLINFISTLFDGVNDEARTGLDPTSLQFERTQKRSMSFLIKTDLPGTTQSILDKQKSSSNFQGWGITIVANKIRYILRNSSAGGGNALIMDSSLTIPVSSWLHIVVTYGGLSTPASVKYYFDGAVDSAPATIANSLTLSTISDERFRIGRRSGSSIPFIGNIDQVTMWNDELSSAEAIEAKNIDRSGQDIQTHSASAKIISHWRMGDSLLFPSIPDVVGSEDLTIINGIDSATSFKQDVAS